MEYRKSLVIISLIALSIPCFNYAMDEIVNDDYELNRVYISGNSGDVSIKTVDNLTYNQCRLSFKEKDDNKKLNLDDFCWKAFSTLCIYIKESITSVEVEIPAMYPIKKEVRVNEGNIFIEGGFGAITIRKNIGNITLTPENILYTNIALQNGNIIMNMPSRVDALLKIYAKKELIQNHIETLRLEEKSFKIIRNWHPSIDYHLEGTCGEGNNAVTITAKNGIVSLEKQADNIFIREKINE